MNNKLDPSRARRFRQDEEESCWLQKVLALIGFCCLVALFYISIIPKTTEQVSSDAMELLNTDTLMFSAEYYYSSNQTELSKPEMDIVYNSFDRILSIITTYKSTSIVIESNPIGLLHATPGTMCMITTAQAELSLKRAEYIRNMLVEYSESRGITIPKEAIRLVGCGAQRPKFKDPRNKEEWMSNMRVAVKVVQGI